MPEVVKNKVLVVAAHPDDEVLGCGATIRNLVNKGWEAHLVIMTGGVGGRHSSQDNDSDFVRAAQNKVRIDAAQAAKIIGFSGWDFFDFPDNRMDTVSRADLTQVIHSVIEKTQPCLVFTHHPGDYNWDHAQTFDAVMMAARPNPPKFSPLEIRTFEVLSSTERSWQTGDRAFHPNLFVDVNKTIDAKKRALQCYKSEYCEYPHPRSIEAIEYLARKRGNEVGLEYAEAFHIVRKVEK